MTPQTTERFDHHRGKLPLLRATSPLRTGVFMAICYAGFLAVSAFRLYISSGQWVNFQLADLWHSLMVLGGRC